MGQGLNVLILLFIIFQLSKQVPIWINNFNQEGIELTSQNYEVISTKELATFPGSGKSAAIFWATWCGPCKIEMKRLKDSVESGKIGRDKIYAINPFESKEVVEQFLRTNDFPFIFIEAPKIVKDLNVELTPTTVLIEESKVHSLKSGISFIGIWTLENFLKD